MKKPTTLFWILATLAAVCILHLVMPKTSLATTIQILVFVVGGALAVFCGDKKDIAEHGDFDAR